MKSKVMSPNIQINTLVRADFSAGRLLVRSSPHCSENMTTRAGFLVPTWDEKSQFEPDRAVGRRKWCRTCKLLFLFDLGRLKEICGWDTTHRWRTDKNIRLLLFLWGLRYTLCAEQFVQLRCFCYCWFTSVFNGWCTVQTVQLKCCNLKIKKNPQNIVMLTVSDVCTLALPGFPLMNFTVLKCWRASGESFTDVTLGRRKVIQTCRKQTSEKSKLHHAAVHPQTQRSAQGSHNMLVRKQAWDQFYQRLVNPCSGLQITRARVHFEKAVNNWRTGRRGGQWRQQELSRAQSDALVNIQADVWTAGKAHVSFLHRQHLCTSGLEINDASRTWGFLLR